MSKTMLCCLAALVLLAVLPAGAAAGDGHSYLFFGPTVTPLSGAVSGERWYYAPEIGVTGMSMIGGVGVDLNLGLGHRFAAEDDGTQARVTAHMVVFMLARIGGSFAMDLFNRGDAPSLYGGPDVILQMPFIDNGDAGRWLPVVGVYYRYEMPIGDINDEEPVHGSGFFIGGFKEWISD